MLFVPLDFSVLYVRDLERLRRVFTLVPEYLRGDTVENERNYMDYGLPLGRRFRALKAWMVFRTFGRIGMRHAFASTCGWQNYSPSGSRLLLISNSLRQCRWAWSVFAQSTATRPTSTYSILKLS